MRSIAIFISKILNCSLNAWKKDALVHFVHRPESYYDDFFCEGPNVGIKKVVEYFRLEEWEAGVFNLAFLIEMKMTVV